MRQTSTYKTVDELPNLLDKAKQPEFKSVDELPDLKKKVSGDGSKEPLDGGLSGTTSTTEPIPTIEMYQTPTGDLTEDPFNQVKKAKELLGKTKVVSKGGIGGMGMGTTGTEIVPDEEATKEANKIQEELKRTGYKEDFFAGISDLPEDVYNNPTTSKETLSVLYNNNPVKFTQLTNEAKNKYAIRDAAAKKAYDEAQGDDKQKTEYASRVGILKGNEYSGDEIAPPENMQQFYDIVRQKQQLIDQNIDSPEEKKKAHERLRQTYAQAINPTSLDFREEYENSGLADKLDVTQYAGLKTYELFEPEKAKVLRSMVEANITPQWNVNVQVTPEEQVRSIVTDSAMAEKMGGTLSQLTVNKRIGKEEALRELSLLGATNEYDSIVSEQNDLKNKYKEAQTDEEKANIYAKMLLNEQRANDLQKTEAKNDERYPITAKLKMDNLVKEIVQDRGIGVGGWMWNKYTHGVGTPIDAASMLLTSWFGSEKDKTDLRMKLIGQGKQFEASIYLPESERSVNSPVIIQASDELKKKAKEILNGRSLSELSLDEKDKLSQLVASNQDQIKTITNPEAGKSKNFWSKATGMTIAGFTADMGSFLTKMGLMQGVGMGAKAAEATTLFMDGYEPAFNKKLAEGASVEAANEYGILHGAILSLMSKFGSKYETIKNVVKGGSSPISKYIAGLSEESWNKLAAESKPLLSKVGAATKNVVKEQGKMIGTFGVAAPVASALADNLFYDEGRSVKEIADEVPLIAKEMAIGGIGFGLFGLAKGVMKTKATPVEKAALFEMADSSGLGKMRIDEAVKNREISKEEGERKKSIIDSVSRLVEQVPEVNDKGKPLNDQQRANYLFNLAVKESQKEKAKTLPEKQAEEAKQKALVADKENQIELEALTEKQLNDRKDKLEKAISKLDEKGKPELSDKEMADAKAELEAVNNIIKSKGDTTKTEEKLPKLSEPIEGVDEFGVPIGENVPAETNPLTKEAEDLLASIGEGSKPTFITKNLERIAKENGIEVTDKMSADDVINALKEKQKQQSEQVGSVGGDVDWSKDIENVDLSKVDWKNPTVEESIAGHENHIENNVKKGQQSLLPAIRELAKKYNLTKEQYLNVLPSIRKVLSNKEPNINSIENIIAREGKNNVKAEQPTVLGKEVGRGVGGDVERGNNPNGGTWETVVSEKDGIKTTRFKVTRKDGRVIQEGNTTGVSGRQMSWDDFLNNFKPSQEDLDVINEGGTPKEITIHELREGKDGRNGMTITVDRGDGNVPTRQEIKFTKAEQPTVSETPTALRDVESIAKALDAKKADIERRRQELESSREIETLYDLTTPIAEDSKEIVAKIDKANELKKEAAVIREQAAKETNEERKIALNSDADSLYEKAIILDKEIKTSRDSVINNTPIKQAIKSAKSLGQRLLNKIKLAAKSNEWVSSMPISKEEFTKLEDAIKRLSVKNMGEVTSNSEVIPDILLIEEINAKYDAELTALEKSAKEPSTVSGKEEGSVGGDVKLENLKVIDGYAFELDKNNSIGNEKVFKINDGEGNNLGKIYIVDKDGAYRIENVRLNKERTGVGYDIYKKLIATLDKPIKSGEVQNEKAKGLWDKLVNEGLAKKDGDGYQSLSTQETKEKQSQPTVTNKEQIPNEPITEPVTKPIPEVTETTQQQGVKEAVPEGTIETGRTEPEGTAAVLDVDVKKAILDAAIDKKSEKGKQMAMEEEAAKYGEQGAKILSEIRGGEPPKPPTGEFKTVEDIGGQDLSGIRKALVSDKIIEGVDLERVSDKEMMSMGRKILDTGEIKPEALVEKIITDGKGVLTPTEVVGLITYKRDIDNALQDTYTKIAEKKAKGEDIGTLGVEAKNLERQIHDFDVMAVITAQQQSMAFRLRQRMLDREYNVVTQIEKYKANNNGEIEADVEAKFRELDKQLKDVKDKLIDAEKRLSEKEGQDAVNNIKESVERENTYTEEELDKKINEGVEKEIAKLYEELPSDKKSAADKAIKALEKFREKIKRRTYESTLGIPMAIADLGAATAIRAIKVGKTVAEAVEIGINRIKKALKEKGIDTWEKESEYRKDLTTTLEEEGVSTKKKPKDKPVINEDGTVSIPNEMLRDLVKRGITDINDLTKAVHDQVKKDLPDISERQVRDYITDYGKKVNPTADEIQIQVNTAKRVGRLLSELEDIRTMGKLEFLAKYQKPKPSESKISEREQELRRQIKALGKDIVGDVSKGTKESESRHQKRIENLEKELLRIRERRHKEPQEKKESTREIEADEQALLDEIEKEQSLWDAEKDAARQFANDYGKMETERNRQLKRVGELNEKIKTLREGKLPEGKVREPKVDTPEIEALKNEKDALEKSVRESISQEKKMKDLDAELQRLKDRKEKEPKPDSKRVISAEERLKRDEIEAERKAWAVEKNIEKLNIELQRVRDRQKKVSSPNERRELTITEKDLVKQINAEKEVWRKEVEPEKKVRQALKDAQKSLDEYERRIAEKDFSKKTESATPETHELKALREKRDAKRKEYEKLKKDSAPKIPKTEAERLKSAKESVKRRITDLETKIKNKDFAKPAKKLQPTDNELVELNAEKERLQEEFDKEQYALELKNRNVWQKWEDRAYEATSGLMRGLTLGVDLSAAGVQGMRRLFTNPKESAIAFWDGLKFLVSEKGANAYMDKQKAQPYYPLLRATKLAIDDKSGKQSVKEGMFVSEWINFIWNKAIAPVAGLGTKWGTDFVRKINPYAASQRAYDGYVNSIRIQTFLKLAKELTDKDGLTYESHPKEFEKLADFVNTTTGRGSLGAADANSRWLNVFLTAPRKVISEVKLYTPYAFVYYARMPKTVRMKALKDFAQFTGTFMAVNALMWAARKDWGDDSDNDNFWNMNSSDFLTHKIGDKRVSIGGGMKSILTMQSRFLTGNFTDQYGETTKLGDRYGKPINTRLDLLTRFAIGKAAPVFNVLAKKLDERAGRPVENEEIIKNISVPLWIQDVGDLYKNDPNSVAPLLMTLSILGANVRTVDKSKSQLQSEELSKEPIFKEYIDKGVNFPELNPEKIQTKEVNGKVIEKLSDYDTKIQEDFIKKKKEYLKQEFLKLKNGTIKVYVDNDGNATTTPSRNKKLKPFNQLTKEQIQNVISTSISVNVTEKVKKEVLKDKKPKK